jgi:hypothetical protein
LKTLTGEAKEHADIAVKAKMEAIQAKQKAVKAFIENARRELSDSPEMAELRILFPGGAESSLVILKGNPSLEPAGQRSSEEQQARKRRANPAGGEPTKSPN